MTQLGNVLLPAMIWQDEYDWLPVTQTIERTVTGGLIIEESPLFYGRPITLTDAWVSRTTLDALVQLAEQPGKKHTLMLRGQAQTVIFNRENDDAIAATPLRPEWDPDGNSIYELTIKLLTVEPDPIEPN
jgi:hypothetical protein